MGELRRDSGDPVRGRDWRPLFLVPLLVVVAAVVGGALLAGHVLRSVAETPPPRVVAITSDGHALLPAVSPDGTRVAYVKEKEDGAAELWVRLIAGGAPLRLAGELWRAAHPAWSPDGSRLAFARLSPDACELVEVPALGGAERHLAECGDRRHTKLSWSPDGRWLAHTRLDATGRRGLALIEVETGELRPLTTPPAGRLGDEWPAFSPDGQLLAFVRYTTAGVADLYRVSLDGGAPFRLTRDFADIVGVDWTAGGRQLVFASNRGGLYGLWSLSASGGVPRLVAGGGSRLEHPSASRRGDVLAYDDWDYEIRIWKIPLVGDGAEAAIVAGRDERSYEPALSPDQARLAFGSTRSGSWELWVAGSDGSEPRQLSRLGGPLVGQPRWSPDGRRLVAVARPEGKADLYVADVEGGQWRRLTDHAADDVMPSWSHDGRTVLFASRRTGSWEVWRVPAAGGEATRVTRGGGYASAESPDGTWLYWTRLDRTGLWRRPLAGGADELVLPELAPEHARDWALTPAGLFYSASIEGETWLLRAEPDGSQSRPLVSLAGQGWSGLDVSADGRWLYLPRTWRRRSRVVAITRD